MRPAEAMSRPLSCVLTSRRTLGTQCPRSGSLTPGDDVTWPALVAGGAVSIGDFGCQACGDMSMSGGGIQRCPSTIGDVTTAGPRHVRVRPCGPCPSACLDVTTVRPVGGHRRAGAGAHRCHPPWTSRRPRCPGGARGMTPASGTGPGTRHRCSPVGRRSRGRARTCAGVGGSPRPGVPAAAAPDQGCPGGDAPGWGRVVADRVTQQRPTGR